MFWLFLLVLVVVATVVIVVMTVVGRKRTLRGKHAEELRVAMVHAAAQADAHRRILDCEKVLDRALHMLGYGGSFADKLKRAGPRFRHTQSLWEAHLLRNRLAHEVGIQLRPDDAARAVKAFEHALRELC